MPSEGFREAWLLRTAGAASAWYGEAPRPSATRASMESLRSSLGSRTPCILHCLKWPEGPSISRTSVVSVQKSYYVFGVSGIDMTPINLGTPVVRALRDASYCAHVLVPSQGLLVLSQEGLSGLRQPAISSKPGALIGHCSSSSAVCVTSRASFAKSLRFPIPGFLLGTGAS